MNNDTETVAHQAVMTTCFLSLGTNIGDKRHNLDEAVRLLGERVGSVVAVSSYHETEPWGFVSDNIFLNACVKLHTVLSSHELLHVTQQIERDLGRMQKSHGHVYHDRVIDIDILLYGDIVVDDDDLKIPHPLMLQRDFVMNPLKEILHT